MATRAGNLCTREYSALRSFGFGAGFISDHICIEGIQCIQCIDGLKLNGATNNREYSRVHRFPALIISVNCGYL